MSEFTPRFLLRNTALDPKFQGTRARHPGTENLLRPPIGGRPLSAQTTRVYRIHELRPDILDDIEKYQAMGVVSFVEVSQDGTEVSVLELRRRLGWAPAEPSLPTAEGDSEKSVRGEPEPAVVIDDVTDLTPDTSLEEPEAHTESEPPVIPAEAQEAAPVEEAVPEVVNAHQPPASVQDPVYTKEELSKLSSGQLGEILARLGGKDYGTKDRKITEILSRQSS